MSEEYNDERDETTHIINALQDEVNSLNDELDTLQGMVDSLTDELNDAKTTITNLEQSKQAPAGDNELRGMAATYRTAARNGHPDAAKHLETLLRALGV